MVVSMAVSQFTRRAAALTLSLAITLLNAPLAALADQSFAEAADSTKANETLALQLNPLNPGTAVATYESDSEIDNLNRQISAKEIELLRLNSEFRTHYTARDKNKQRRMKLYDFAAGAVANAGDIALLTNFWKYQRKPGEGLAKRGRLESGVITVFVAYCILGGLYSLEGASDLIADYKGKRKHFDAKSIRERVNSIKEEIDSLLAKRATIVANLDGAQKQYFIDEEAVLRDLRDLSILEFSKLYIDSRKKHTARDITTIGTLAVCATGAFPGALNVLRGIRETRINTIGGGGIGFLISGATLTAAPVLIHGGAAVTAKVAGSRLSKLLGEAQCKTTEKLRTDLNKLMGGNNTETYSVMAKLLEDREVFLKADSKTQKQDMIESFISYAARGGPQIAFGINVARAGYRYDRNPYKVFKGVAQGATVNEVSWALWMLDVVQKQTRNEIRNAKESHAGPNAFSAEYGELKKLK